MAARHRVLGFLNLGVRVEMISSIAQSIGRYMDTNCGFLRMLWILTGTLEV